MKKRCADPEYRARMSEARKKNWEDPEYRAHMSEQRALRARERKGPLNGHYKHGYYKSPEFWAYFNAKQRCENPKNPQYPGYGGRGLAFGFPSFAEFIEHIGPRPSKEHSLDRIDNGLGYLPGNIRWTTSVVQISNRRKFGALEGFSDAALFAEIRRRGRQVVDQEPEPITFAMAPKIA